MTKERDLLDAVTAAPDDDGPRLVFADWIEEHGDPERAEFIRLQIRLAGIDEYDPDFKRLANRESELLRENDFRWKIPNLKGRQEFQRGFVDFVWTRADRLSLDAEMINQTPTVTSLRVSGADHRLGDVAKLPFLHRLRKLDFSNNTLPARDQLLHFFERVKLPSLSGLALRNNMLWPEQLAALAVHPAFPRLRFVDVSGNPLGDEGMGIVANEQAFRDLRTLVFRSNRLDISHAVHGPGATFLGQAKSLMALRHLDLNGHTIGDEGVIAIGSSEKMPRLEWLDLSDNDIGLGDDNWSDAFNRHSSLTALRVLRLRKNRIGRLARHKLMRWKSERPGRVVDTGADTETEDIPR